MENIKGSCWLFAERFMPPVQSGRQPFRSFYLQRNAIFGWLRQIKVVWMRLHWLVSLKDFHERILSDYLSTDSKKLQIAKIQIQKGYLRLYLAVNWRWHGSSLWILITKIFPGMVVGSYIWGNIADSRGRKWGLIAALLMDSLAALASSVAQSFPLFLFFRFFNGFGWEKIITR